MTRVSLGESKLKVRRRRRRTLLLALSGLAVLVLFGGILELSRASFLRIRTVDVAGAATLDPQAIVQYAQADLAGAYAYVFPKNDILLYPKKSIEQGLLAQFPALKTARVQAENFQTIAVTVTERTPVALWCGVAVATTSDCYLLDESGLAYAPAADYSAGTYDKFFGTATGTLPKQYLTSPQFRSLLPLVGALAKQAGERVSSILVDENADVHLQFESGFTLLFALSDDGADVLQRFSLSLVADPFASRALSDFSYLDLRFGDKVYYKLK